MNSSLSALARSGSLVASLVVFAACGGDDEQRTRVTVTLRGPNDNHAQQIFGFPAAQVNSIAKVRVTAFRGFALQERVEFEYGALTGELPTIGYGPDNWLAVEGFDAAGNVLASGASQWFSLASGDPPVSLEVFTTRPKRFTTAFRFDPADSVSKPATFELPPGRTGAATAVLPDGRILVMGGAQVTLTGGVPAITTYFDTIQVYQPQDGNWFTLTTPGCDVATQGVDACATRLLQPVAFAAAAAIDDNRVVISGGLARDADLGVDVASARVAVLELTGALEASLTAVAAPVTGGAVPARAFHTATQATDGRIVFIGGMSGQYSSPSFPAAIDEIQLQPTLIYQATGASLTTPRALHAAVNYNEGDHGILVTGGRNASAVVGSSEVVYLTGGAVASEPFAARPGSVDLATARFGQTAIPYTCPGSTRQYLFVAGGFTEAGGTLLQGANPTDLVEVYDPSALAETDAYSFLRDDALRLARARAFAAGGGLPGSGDVLVAGGTDGAGGVLESAELFTNFDWSQCGSFTRSGQPDRSEIADGLVEARAMASAFTLPSQFIFFVGGTSGTASLATSEFYNSNDYAIIYGTEAE